jgi:cytoskeletal protein RodZ
MSTFMKRLLLGAMLIAVSLSAHSAFYKWVDANGVTQYSQSPPPSGHYQEMRSSLPAGDTNAERQSAETSSPSQGSPTDPVAAAPPDDKQQARKQAAREQNCQLAKQRLSQLENHPRIRFTAADGSVRVMSEEEKQVKLMETRKMMDEMCQ